MEHAVEVVGNVLSWTQTLLSLVLMVVAVIGATEWGRNLRLVKHRTWLDVVATAVSGAVQAVEQKFSEEESGTASLQKKATALEITERLLPDGVRVDPAVIGDAIEAEVAKLNALKGIPILDSVTGT